MSARPLDLDPRSREALEFDALLDNLAALAITTGGGRRLRSLTPLADSRAVALELDAVEEARTYLDREGQLLGGPLPDPAPALKALGVEEMPVPPGALRDLAAVAAAAADLRRRLAGLPEDDFPRLRDLGAGLPDLGLEAESVLRHVDPEGRIADSASRELHSLRSAAIRLGDRLRGLLERYLRDPQAAAVIRDDFITQRGGRYVIPVRSDAPRPIHGIVHATSSSGATRFVEPLESVELNNELVRLADAEREEQERIVRAWAGAFRVRLDDVTGAVETLEYVDTLQARARFAREAGAARPELSEEGGLELKAARHPLLDRRLREEGQRCVPLDLSLTPEERVLVLSGPNTGGKTVALKTVGLAVLMAQAGIPVPAGEARIPLFRQLRADIGDHQSIQADLSTYSAHIRAVVDFLRRASPPALFLFDEIGTGTEPTEGAALARSILEALRVPGMVAMATTHHRELKTWAFGTPGVACAAMEFDTDSMRPTFRVLRGVAGTSAGLEIAARLGLDESIVGRARGYLGTEARRGESYMARLRELTTGLERRQEELVARQRDLERESRKRATALAEREQRLRTRVSRQLDGALQEFRRKARAELAAIGNRRERRRVERDQGKAESRLRAERARIEGELPGAGPTVDPPQWRLPDEVREGMRVLVRSLSRRGVVQSVRGDEVEVQLGRMTFTVSRSDLRIGPSIASEPGPAADPGRGQSGVSAPPARETGTEVLLVGKRVEEALDELDRFLDGAALSGLDEVRVIHGHGTGRLRKAVRAFLASHVHVDGQRPGKPYEGGDGVTVVTLK